MKTSSASGRSAAAASSAAATCGRRRMAPVPASTRPWLRAWRTKGVGRLNALSGSISGALQQVVYCAYGHQLTVAEVHAIAALHLAEHLVQGQRLDAEVRDLGARLQ